MSVHDRIKLNRKSKDLTQEEMAEHLGISQAQYSRLERGETGLKLSHLETLADIFGVTVSDLVASRQPAAVAG